MQTIAWVLPHSPFIPWPAVSLGTIVDNDNKRLRPVDQTWCTRRYVVGVVQEKERVAAIGLRFLQLAALRYSHRLYSRTAPVILSFNKVPNSPGMTKTTIGLAMTRSFLYQTFEDAGAPALQSVLIRPSLLGLETRLSSSAEIGR